MLFHSNMCGFEMARAARADGRFTPHCSKGWTWAQAAGNPGGDT